MLPPRSEALRALWVAALHETVRSAFVAAGPHTLRENDSASAQFTSHFPRKCTEEIYRRGEQGKETTVYGGYGDT